MYVTNKVHLSIIIIIIINSPSPPNLTISQEKNGQTFSVELKVCYKQVSGPVQTTCSNTLSSIRTKHFSHTTVCI